MSRAVKKINLRKFILVMAACLLCYSAVKIIVDERFFWLAIPALPLVAYLSIREPFIFPFGMYLFLIPFDSVLSVTGRAQGTTLTKLLGILTMMILLIKGSFENRFVQPDKTVLCWTFLGLYAASNYAWAIEPQLVLYRIPMALGLLTFYLIVSFYRASEKQWNTLKIVLLLGGFLASIFSIYSYFSGSFYMESQRATLMFGGRQTNPDDIGFSLLIPVSICLEILFADGKFDWKKIACILVLATMLFCAIVTGSRGAMLGIGVIFLVFLLSSGRKFAMGLFFIAISLPLVSLMLQFLTARWGDAYSSGGAGRLEIWSVGLRAIRAYWLTGAGTDNFPIAYTQFVNYGTGFEGFFRASHNIYLQFIVEQGLIGTAFLFWGLIRHYMLIRSKRDAGESDKKMLTGAFWAMLAAAFFGDFFWDKSFWVLWMMIIIFDNLHKTARGFKTVMRDGEI